MIQTPGGLIHRIPFQYLVGGFHMFPLPIHPFMHWIRYPQLSTYVNLGELCPPSSGWVSELPKSRSLRHAVCFMRGQWNHQSSWACFNHYINTLWTGWWVMHVSARCRPLPPRRMWRYPTASLGAILGMQIVASRHSHPSLWNKAPRFAMV